ncbi:unnamed protein product [Rhizoctonia solani]|nr:unnamed protein product [Rhizoctonia solani]
MQKLAAVDLFCPHPFLRQQSLSRVTSATGQTRTSELHCGLTSTTTFRSFGFQIHPSPQQLRSLIVSLLQFWQQVNPQDVSWYAVALRPVVCLILGMYLGNEFELDMSELIQIGELGRTVAEHCQSPGGVGVVAGSIHQVNVEAGSRVAIGTVGSGRSPMEEVSVPVTR